MKKLLFVISIVLFISCKNEFNDTTKLENIPTQVLLDNSNSLFSNQLPDSEFSKFYLKKESNTYIKYFNVSLNTNSDDSMTFESAEISPETLVEEVLDFIDFAAEGRKTMIHVNFEKNSSFGHYKKLIDLINQLKQKKISINTNFFVYDTKKLPDCNCTL